MAKIKLHGVSINTEAFKTAKSVSEANLFAHLGEGAEAAENDLLAVLNIVDKKAKKEKVEKIEVAAENLPELDENADTGA
jgi:hypothetical protein